ncbi:MAG: EamA family transporter RarD [Proteobacteria bacterium]|nr:EamA family transporter RarD [Pseudomonadota bacterium]
MHLTNQQKGFAAGVFSFVFWGFLPIYFKFIQYVPALTTIAHRIIWGAVFLLLFLIIRERNNFFKAMGLSVKQVAGLLLSGLLVASNWLIFVWAINNDQILSTSLGYFINPLVNVVLGVLFLHESLSKAQRLALIIATIATLFYAINLGQPPWIALFLAFTFGLYGFVRKKLNVKPLVGLMWETMLLAIPSIIYLLLYAPAIVHVNASNTTYLFLFFSGLMTVLPLIAFNYATKKLPLSIIGFIQYLGPTISFLIAVFYYGETFTFGHKVVFLGIWLALLIVSWSPLKKLMQYK